MMVILTMLAVLAGIFYGAGGFDLLPVSFLAEHTNGILYVLMLAVGISVGMQEGIFRKISQYNIKIFIIPFGVILGSVLGGMLCSVVTGIPLNSAVAIGGGMGWYSLSGAAISELAGAEMGSIAFLSNLMREIFSFFLIPFLAVKLNNYSCIASAGATSEDTTLPMMLKYTNEETVVLSVLNGMICSFFVPILISLCFPG